MKPKNILKAEESPETGKQNNAVTTKKGKYVWSIGQTIKLTDCSYCCGPEYVMQKGDLPEHLPVMHGADFYGGMLLQHFVPDELTHDHVTRYYEV